MLEVYLLVSEDRTILKASFDKQKIHKLVKKYNSGDNICGPYYAVMSIEVEDEELLLNMQFENMDVLPIRVKKESKSK